MALTCKIALSKFNWVSSGNCHVVGFAWFNSAYFDGQGFAKLVADQSLSFEKFSAFAAGLNGQFSVLIANESEIWAFCSQTWSFPLFYRHANTLAEITDEPSSLLTQHVKVNPDSFASRYFTIFGVTPANQTLLHKVFQVLPAELIKISANKTERFSIGINDDETHSEEQITPEDAYQKISRVFERHLSVFANRLVLLPLTRGYDSRLLACLLKKYDYKNVVCATWGRNNNIELATAKRVADSLGFPHVFIDYSEEVKHGFTTEKVFSDYIGYAGHYSSMPYLQDYFAVRKLKAEGIIDDKTIVMPGHPGDFLRGSHLEPRYQNASIESLTTGIIEKFGSALPIQRNERNELKGFIAENFFDSRKPLWNRFETWDLIERQSKFIGNSVSVFSFFGIDARMPLFDNEMLGFFKCLSFEQKSGAAFYNSTLENYFFKPFNVAFDLKDSKVKSPAFPRIKKAIIELVPRKLKEMYYPVNDAICYREITAELLTSAENFVPKHPVKPHSYNAYIIQWYLNYLKSM